MAFLPERLHLGGGWTPKNRQADKTPEDRYGYPLPECPHYTLLEICAALAGVLPNELAQKEKFCGQAGKYEDSIGPLTGFRGVIKEPRATCAEIYRKLRTMITFMRQEATSDTQQITEVLHSTNDIRSKKRELDAHVQALDIQKEQRQILLNWQQVIFETCCVPTDSIKPKRRSLPEPNWTTEQKRKPVSPMGTERQDPHFRRIESPTDLSYDEVLTRVEQLLSALENQVTGNSRETFWFGKGALHCPQAPEREEIGVHS